MEKLNKNDIKQVFAQYMKKMYHISDNEAEICAMSLLEPESFDCFVFQEYIEDVNLNGEEFQKLLVYVNFENFFSFTTMNPLFCFYSFENQEHQFYNMNVDDKDVKEIFGDEWTCKG